jgi:aerobic carbon-monoxide dehydrogenase medium subunit
MEKALTSNFSAAAIQGVAVDAGGMLSDMHGSAAYRANLVKVMAERAIAGA